jgi:TonB family protein
VRRMTRALAWTLILMAVATPCPAQNATKTDPSACAPKIQKKASFPKGSVKIRPNEVYKNLPVVKYRILEDGSVSNVKLVRRSGVSDVDREAVDWVQSTKYNARPGCGVVDSTITVAVDFTSDAK